jgi:hypothetical protein
MPPAVNGVISACSPALLNVRQAIALTAGAAHQLPFTQNHRSPQRVILTIGKLFSKKQC